MKQIDIAELDVIFLTYDEKNKEENWTTIKNIVPWAHRIDGIKGSDAAHKAAGEASTTDRFILIDGDNIPMASFFDQTLMLSPNIEQAVFRWRAKNHINGLKYGNGGLSSWTKSYVKNMKTHENTDGRDETQVEFCFDPLYIPMHDCFSTTYPNSSPMHAWRAGFREGVKMCLNRGAKFTPEDFQNCIPKKNLDNLTIWQNVGRDIENGIWAIAGARMGTYMTMLTKWDMKGVQDFEVLQDLWETIKNSDPELLAGRIAEDLVGQLDLPICVLDDRASAFFKQHYASNWKNKGIMVTEADSHKLQ